MRRRLLLANSHGSGWSEKTMIFYVDRIAYTAYEGMTWGDWIDSKYNVDGFCIYENYIMEINEYYYVDNVSPEMNIIANTNYTLNAEMDPE